MPVPTVRRHPLFRRVGDDGQGVEEAVAGDRVGDDVRAGAVVHEARGHHGGTEAGAGRGHGDEGAEGVFVRVGGGGGGEEVGA